MPCHFAPEDLICARLSTNCAQKNLTPIGFLP
jgi:hypothetical protein